MNVKFWDAVEDQLERWNDHKKRQIAARRLEPRGTHKPRCKECGLKIRGPNHADGPDHIKRAGKKAAVA